MVTQPTLQGIAASLDALLTKAGIQAPAVSAVTMIQAQALLQAGPKTDGSDFATGITLEGQSLVLKMARATPFGTQNWSVPIQS